MPFTKPSYAGFGLILESDVPGDREFDFRARGGAAKHVEPRPNFFRSLTHPRKPPMSVAARPQNTRVDATAIVSHHHAQIAGRVLEFYFNPLRASVMKRVDQRLAADSIHLIPQHRV